MIKCSDIFKSTKIDSYYEFIFAMCLAEECGRLGNVLDMSMMRIRDKSMLSVEDIEYMHYLRGKGYIFDGKISSEEVSSYDGKYSFNNGILETLGSKVFCDKGDEYYWDTSYAYDVYGDYISDVLKRDKIGNTIIHLVAYMIISWFFGTNKVKPIRFYFKTLEVRSPNMYLDLYACCKKLDILKDVSIVFDENCDSTVDLDFLILYTSAQHARHIKLWSMQEKFDIFRQYGFKEGSIALLFERERVSKNNPIGVITWASVIRINSYSEDLSNRNAGWNVTRFNVNKTIEEVEDDYLGIDEEYREAFSDLLDEKIPSADSFLSFEVVGIGEYFKDESYLILPIERGDKVIKKVSVDGKIVTIEMDEVDAIYWILKEYGIDFDDILYKEFYNDGKPLLWDKYDCTPVKRTGTYID